MPKCSLLVGKTCSVLIFSSSWHKVNRLVEFSRKHSIEVLKIRSNGEIFAFIYNLLRKEKVFALKLKLKIL